MAVRHYCTLVNFTAVTHQLGRTICSDRSARRRRRMLKRAQESRIALGDSHVMHSWAMMYAAGLLNRYRKPNTAGLAARIACEADHNTKEEFPALVNKLLFGPTSTEVARRHMVGWARITDE